MYLKINFFNTSAVVDTRTYTTHSNWVTVHTVYILYRKVYLLMTVSSFLFTFFNLHFECVTFRYIWMTFFFLLLYSYMYQCIGKSCFISILFCATCKYIFRIVPLLVMPFWCKRINSIYPYIGKGIHHVR